MCNLERYRTNQDELRQWFGVEFDYDFTGNLQVGDVYPRGAKAVIRRRSDGVREIVSMNWGFPYVREGLKRDGNPYAPKPTTNVRHPHYSMWREWAQNPQQRCLVPSTAFAEPNANAKEPGQPKNVWFGMKAPQESLYAFAGLWRPWNDDWDKTRASKQSDVYAILTCAPNELVAPIHEKGMPVILHRDDYEKWLSGTWSDIRSLHRPYPADQMAIYPESEEELRLF